MLKDVNNTLAWRCVTIENTVIVSQIHVVPGNKIINM